ncbi:hypothetical protein ACFV9G_06230 [Nocardioides sp. NPDC059952]|uniref:hypothetical protein n=1 Tax=Nocardioides sp. NPDC059952 TaxID=3347014 RepID=UPI003656A324
MKLEVSIDGRVEVLDVHALTALSVRAPASMSLDTLDAGLREGAWGECAELDHAWLEVAALSECGPTDEQWRTDFNAMIDYADGRGWTRSDRTQVRAHIEYDVDPSGSDDLLISRLLSTRWQGAPKPRRSSR